MDNSSANLARESVGTLTPPVNLQRFPFGRLLVAGVICGPLYGFAVLSGLPQISAWLMSVFVVAGIFFPVLWILAKELRVHGFGGVSTARLLLVSSSFVGVCIVSFFVLSIAIIAAWPYLGLPPMPSD